MRFDNSLTRSLSDLFGHKSCLTGSYPKDHTFGSHDGQRHIRTCDKFKTGKLQCVLNLWLPRVDIVSL